MLRKKLGKSKYIILTNQHLYIADSLESIKKQSGMLIEEMEMKRIDGHFIANMSDADIDFAMDKQRMSNIPWKNLIKKDNTINYMLYGVIALQIIAILKG